MTTTTEAWPTGVIARYLTLGGDTVDIKIYPADQYRTAVTVASCFGCGATKAVEWVTGQAERDPNGAEYTNQGRQWAQDHAATCRAMPQPGSTS